MPALHSPWVSNGDVKHFLGSHTCLQVGQSLEPQRSQSRGKARSWTWMILVGLLQLRILRFCEMWIRTRLHNLSLGTHFHHCLSSLYHNDNWGWVITCLKSLGSEPLVNPHIQHLQTLPAKRSDMQNYQAGYPYLGRAVGKRKASV